MENQNQNLTSIPAEPLSPAQPTGSTGTPEMQTGPQSNGKKKLLLLAVGAVLAIGIGAAYFLGFLGGETFKGSFLESSQLKLHGTYDADKNEVTLIWEDKTGIGNIIAYQITRSEKADGERSVIGKISASMEKKLIDAGVEKEKTYFYVIAALDKMRTKVSESKEIRIYTGKAATALAIPPSGEPLPTVAAPTPITPEAPSIASAPSPGGSVSSAPESSPSLSPESSPESTPVATPTPESTPEFQDPQLSATAKEDGTVELVWSDNTDPSKLNKYTIYRSTKSEKNQKLNGIKGEIELAGYELETIEPGAKTYTDSLIGKTKNYVYTVLTNGKYTIGSDAVKVNTAVSNQVEVTVPETVLPETVINRPELAGSVNANGKIELTWTDHTLPSKISSYEIYKSGTPELTQEEKNIFGEFKWSGVVVETVTPETKTFTDENIERGKTYYYEVKTIIKRKETDETAEVSNQIIVTPSSPPPEAVTLKKSSLAEVMAEESPASKITAA